jgi:hypothetical protein
MIGRRRTPRHLRAAAFALALSGLAASAFVSCSSDAPTPLGSQDDLLGSRPGTVYQDTIGVYADSVYAFNSLIAADSVLQLGRADGYTRTIILQPGFANSGLDINRVVSTAVLRLVASDAPATYPVRFYRLRRSYAEGDSVGSLDTLAAVADPTNGSPNRTLQAFPETYPLPPALVQGWIRNDTTRTALAIMYTDDLNDRVAAFQSHNSAANRPSLQVTFTDNSQRSYPISADANFIRPAAPLADRGIRDGYLRRLYFRVHLDDLAPDAAIHTAKVHFHIVPGSVIGSNLTAVVYVPKSTNRANADFLTGQLVTEPSFLDTDSTLVFPITNALFLTLQGNLDDNGFIIRFKNENSEFRQLQLYGSNAAPALRPQVYVTSSTPAVFKP